MVARDMPLRLDRCTNFSTLVFRIFRLTRHPSMKVYDQNYFDRWYRHPAIASRRAKVSREKCEWRSQ